MKIWRISNYADLKGQGGLSFAGRWHSKGKPVVYTAEHPALALLEILTHLSAGNLPETYQLLEIELPPGLSISTTEIQGKWQNDEAATQRLGNRWLAEGRTAVFQVPSAVLPKTWNYLINPLHEDAGKIRILSTQKYPFDKRLK